MEEEKKKTKEIEFAHQETLKLYESKINERDRLLKDMTLDRDSKAEELKKMKRILQEKENESRKVDAVHQYEIDLLRMTLGDHDQEIFNLRCDWIQKMMN